MHVQAVCPVLSASVTPLTVAYQASLCMEFSRQEYWSELPFPTLGDLCNPGMETVSLVWLVLAGEFFTTAPPEKPNVMANTKLNSG